MDYGLPGKPGYSYRRPFDYFNFEAALSSANGIENLTSNGMLLGDHYALGDRVRGIAGVYGGYEYLAPQVFRVSTTSVSLGTTLQWWATEQVRDPGGRLRRRRLRGSKLDPAQRRLDRVPLRHGAARGDEPAADRWRPGVAGRRRRASCRCGRIANRRAGRDDISRVESALTWRIAGPHAIGVSYVWSHRSAAFRGGVDQRQTLGQFGVYYTLLGPAGLRCRRGCTRLASRERTARLWR